jgi:hypothetical protein
VLYFCLLLFWQTMKLALVFIVLHWLVSNKFWFCTVMPSAWWRSGKHPSRGRNCPGFKPWWHQKWLLTVSVVSCAFKAALGALGLRVTHNPCDDGLSQPFSARRWLSFLVMQCRGGGPVFLLGPSYLVGTWEYFLIYLIIFISFWCILFCFPYHLP